MGGFARGSYAPTVAPVWARHLLSARALPRVTHAHREYDEQAAVGTEPFTGDDEPLVSRSFFFGGAEMSALRRLLTPNMANRGTDAEVLTSFLWRHRTADIRPDPNKEMRVILVVRSKLKHPPLPRGYYGNAFALPVAIATARELADKPLEFALRLVKEAKSSVTEEYIRSLADLMVTRGRPRFTTDGAYFVADVRNLAGIDIGSWGKPVYGGIATAGVVDLPECSFYVSFENRKGEVGIVVPVCLPEKAMQRFEEKLDEFVSNGGSKNTNKVIMSSL